MPCAARGHWKRKRRHHREPWGIGDSSGMARSIGSIGSVGGIGGIGGKGRYKSNAPYAPYAVGSSLIHLREVTVGGGRTASYALTRADIDFISRERNSTVPNIV
jgi:hypothetical protein